MSAIYTYYKGWVIVIAPDGFTYVNSREDKWDPKPNKFDCMDCAMDWVDGRGRRHER